MINKKKRAIGALDTQKVCQLTHGLRGEHTTQRPSRCGGSHLTLWSACARCVAPTATEVLLMSPSGSRTSPAAPLVYPSGRPVTPAELSAQGTEGQRAAEKDSRSPRAVGAARVRQSRRPDPYPFRDPCNYLG